MERIGAWTTLCAVIILAGMLWAVIGGYLWRVIAALW
jgi:hypothetical protein